jgi:hypothetical protein
LALEGFFIFEEKWLVLPEPNVVYFHWQIKKLG